MAEPVAIEFGEDGVVVLTGGLEGEFSGPPVGGELVVGFSDGTLLRCARTADGEHVLPVRTSLAGGTIDLYQVDERSFGAEINGTRYLWAMANNEVIHALP